MRMPVRTLALGLVLAVGSACVAPAIAEAPNPFESKPKARAAVIAERGDDADRIIGGREAEEGEYPFQVALLRADYLSDDPESQYNAEFCGGSLIAPTWVLTAAHCMSSYGEPMAVESFVVLTGTKDLMSGQRVAPKQVIVHEAYDEWTMDNDIALVELASPVSLPPVDLDYDAMGATSAVVIGWGLTESGDYPRYLLESDIEVVPNAECNVGIKTIHSRALKDAVRELAVAYGIPEADSNRVSDELATRIRDPLTANMLCAGVKAGGRDSCYGDSGGPLVATREGRTVQLGIVSWGEGPAEADVKCGHEDVYGVYARVSSYADWIRSHIGTN